MKFAFLLMAIVLVIWFGCSCGGSSPTEILYSISGYVVLHGTETDSAGVVTGELEVIDADSVKVDLLNSTSKVVSTTYTSDGQYVFMNVSAGEYRCVVIVADISGDTTGVMMVSESDIQSPDTLTLRSSGLILAYENPFDEVVTLRFTQSVSDSATLDILGTNQALVRNLKNQFLPPGEYSIAWNGARDDSSLVMSGPYWGVYKSGSTVGNELLIKR